MLHTHGWRRVRRNWSAYVAMFYILVSESDLEPSLISLWNEEYKLNEEWKVKSTEVCSSLVSMRHAQVYVFPLSSRKAASRSKTDRTLFIRSNFRLFQAYFWEDSDLESWLSSAFGLPIFGLPQRNSWLEKFAIVSSASNFFPRNWRDGDLDRTCRWSHVLPSPRRLVDLPHFPCAHQGENNFIELNSVCHMRLQSLHHERFLRSSCFFFKLNFACQADLRKRAFSPQFSHPLPCKPRIPVEAILKTAFPVVGKCHWQEPHRWFQLSIKWHENKAFQKFLSEPEWLISPPFLRSENIRHACTSGCACS